MLSDCSNRETFNQFNYSTSGNAAEGKEGYELVKKWLKSIVPPQHSVVICELADKLQRRKTSAYCDNVKILA